MGQPDFCSFHCQPGVSYFHRLFWQAGPLFLSHTRGEKKIRVCKYEHLSSNVQHPCEKVMHTCNPRVDVGGDRWILSSLATSTVEKQLSPGSVRTLPHGDKAE